MDACEHGICGVLDLCMVLSRLGVTIAEATEGIRTQWPRAVAHSLWSEQPPQVRASSVRPVQHQQGIANHLLPSKLRSSRVCITGGGSATLPHDASTSISSKHNATFVLLCSASAGTRIHATAWFANEAGYGGRDRSS